MTPQSAMPWYEAAGGDVVYTPDRATDALVDSSMGPPMGLIRDPYAGNGAILKRLIGRGWDREQLYANEIRQEERAGLEDLLDPERVLIKDFIADVQLFSLDEIPIVTNVPFSRSIDAMEACLSTNPPYFATLIPIEELAGVKRATWFNDNKPTGIVSLSFRVWGGSRGIVWAVWDRTRGRGLMNLEIV